MARREQPFSTSSNALSYLVLIGLLLMGFLPVISKLTGLVTTPHPERPIKGRTKRLR